MSNKHRKLVLVMRINNPVTLLAELPSLHGLRLEPYWDDDKATTTATYAWGLQWWYHADCLRADPILLEGLLDLWAKSPAMVWHVHRPHTSSGAIGQRSYNCGKCGRP